VFPRSVSARAARGLPRLPFPLTLPPAGSWTAMDHSPGIYRFEAATLGAHGNSLLSAVTFALRRGGLPVAARCPLDRALHGLTLAAHQLRTAVALRVEHIASLAPELEPELWSAVELQLGGPCLEAGPVPTCFRGYLEALHRDRRYLDSLQLLALADVLRAHLHLFVPLDPLALAAGWQLRWVAAPCGPDLAPLACFRPPLCIGLASGRAWALEPGSDPADAWGPGRPDTPTAVLRAQGALPSISSPTRSSLSLLVEDLERRAGYSSESDGPFFGEAASSVGGRSGTGWTDGGAPPSPSLPATPPEGDVAAMDCERGELEEALLSAEALDLGRHLDRRARFHTLLHRARTASTLLGRLP
jgi:hypothetical protein